MEQSHPQGYLGDILAQPAALRSTFDGLRTSPELLRLCEQARQGRFRQILLTGMGSSLHVFYPLSYRLVEQGWPAPVMIETSELIHYARSLLRPDTLVLACSQSGRSAETIRLLELNHQAASLIPISLIPISLIGITNTPGSPLAEQSAAQVFTQAGSESTVSCKTYLAALLALDWLGDILLYGETGAGFSENAALPDQVGAYLADWRSHVDWLKSALRQTRRLFLLGRGPSLAAVETGGLTTKESAHVHAEGMSSAAFRHGPLEMIGPDTSVVLFEGPPATRGLHQKLQQDIQRAGGQVLWIGESSTSSALRLPQAAERVRPILEMLPVQMMTLALASLQGHTAGEFDRATKITEEE